jgi:membrane protein YqaA with SNARE-associated domain
MEADSLWLSLLFVASMIPFIEYTLAVPVGILFVNQPPVLTVLVSILGNSIGVVLLVLLSEKIRDWTLKRQNSQKSGRQSSKQQEKTKHFLEKVWDARRRDSCTDFAK